MSNQPGTLSFRDTNNQAYHLSNETIQTIQNMSLDAFQNLTNWQGDELMIATEKTAGNYSMTDVSKSGKEYNLQFKAKILNSRNLDNEHKEFYCDIATLFFSDNFA